MSLKQLNLIFKCGSIFALTPIKIEATRIVFSSRIYALIWILLLTTGVTISGIYKQTYFKQFTSIQLIIQISNDILLFTFNIFTIIISQRKKHEWRKLITHFKTTEETEINNRFWFLPFLSANVVFIIFKCWNTIQTTNLIGVLYFQQHAVEYFHSYAQFIVCFLLYVILNILFQKYETVYNNLSKLLEIQLEANYLSILKKMRNYICVLAECVEIFNDIFGWLILQLIGFIFFGLLMLFCSLMLNQIDSPEKLVYTVLWILC